MAENNDNLIGIIRQRTEEEELKQYLKTTVGGYTKSSVMEYLAALRKRQQNSSETFNENMQSLLEEKESLKVENEKLLTQIAQAKTDFLRLAELKKQQEQHKAEAAFNNEQAINPQEPSKAGAANDNIVYLKSNSQTTEKASINTDFSRNQLEKETEALKNEVLDKNAEVDKLKKELAEQLELLAQEKLEAKKQRERASELSELTQQLDEKLRSMQDKFSEDKLAQLNDQISELTDQVDRQNSSITQLRNDVEDKEESIKVLLDENVTMMKSMELMSNSLDNMAIQNEKLLTANNALAQAYEDESKKVVTLINEKSEEVVEKLIIARKLEQIMGGLSSYNLSNPEGREASQNAGSKTSIA